MKYETVMFDLDGTLIGLNMDEFLSIYMSEVENWAAEHVDDISEFMQQFDRAVRAMLAGKEPHMTNEEVFFSRMLENAGVQRTELQRMFDAFYEEVFPDFEKYCTERPEAVNLIDRLKSEGYRLVVATNPLFPETAIRQRLSWGNLYPECFDHITTYENSRYCKPHPNYYRDILDELQIDPCSALMVGNDTVEDLIAQKRGIDTYLVEGYIIEHPGKDLEPTYNGSLKEVYQVLG